MWEFKKFGETAVKMVSWPLLSSWVYLAYLIESPKMFSTVIEQKVLFMLQDLRHKDTCNFNVYYRTKDVSSFGMLHKNIHFSLAKQNYIQKFDNICVETQKLQNKISFDLPLPLTHPFNLHLNFCSS